MTDRFLFSILSTSGIISGVTSLSFGSAYVVGKYMPRPKQIKYTNKKIAEITSIEDIREYEDVQGCMFLFKNKSEVKPTLTGASPPRNIAENGALSSGYESLDRFRSKNHTSINDRKIVIAAESKRSQCHHGSAVYVEII